jgi:hypothetical protein
MISTIACLVALQTTQEPSGGAIVSKMLARYDAAQSLTGSIRLTQGAGKEAGTLDTFIQYEKPSKLYIKQVLNSSGRTWLITSDGVNFSYNRPENLPTGKTQIERLREPVQPRGSEPLDLKSIYAVAGQCLPDRSAPLDIAIGWKDYLRLFVGQLATAEYAGRTKIGDTEVQVVRGGWREDSTRPVMGRYEIYITDEGDLKRYVVAMPMKLDPRTDAIEVVSHWEVKLSVNGKPEAALFKVIY